MHKLTSILFRARYGWLLTVGVVLAAPLIQNNKLGRVGIVVAATAVSTIATFMRVDLPRLPAMNPSSS